MIMALIAGGIYWDRGEQEASIGAGARPQWATPSAIATKKKLSHVRGLFTRTKSPIIVNMNLNARKMKPTISRSDWTGLGFISGYNSLIMLILSQVQSSVSLMIPHHKTAETPDI